MRTARSLLLPAALLALLPACAAGGPGDAGPADGRLVAALSMPELAHDVAAVRIKVLPAGADCGDPALAEQVVPLEDEYLPLWLEDPASAGPYHPFADGLFVLQPGDYRVCAMPLDAFGEPSAECAMTSTAPDAPVTVVAEQTTEIVLYALCEGDPTGALDVVVALNDPPHIDTLVIDESKFITLCDKATVSVTASDPNGDALTFAWAVTGAPAGAGWKLVPAGATATFTGDTAGPYELTVTVDDGHGGTASLSFPVHVSDDGTAFFASDFDGGAPAGLQLNQAATVATVAGDGVLQLTPSAVNQRGTALLTTLVPAVRWYASFEFTIGEKIGSGADGVAFVIYSPSVPATYAGSLGGGIGYKGATGWAVEFDTFLNTAVGDTTGNHVAIVRALDQSIIATNDAIPVLEDTGPHFAEIQFDTGDLEVWLDGVPVLSATLPGFSMTQSRLGLTAATGGSADFHRVDDLFIGCAPPLE